ncbi:hypothetical protein [Alkalitalea saponilacus]|uniref:Uncharacterized protein n=1 Tax=Alkalitalea saponilacus TaxID=889453 RepID=A0A1T5HLG8_9BACT|nr:hypothetical protein [Alkalitalea saponilacus]ASB47817.1 hypothetical protein CDL62_00950 [Alkalitalea saponilacus]SKC21489.1 hypothetical protein SAMN03080601_02425 [Alkalitalea saponilacus]
MKSIWLLYVGLSFIGIAIVLRVLAFDTTLTSVLFSVGGLIKILYLFFMYREAKLWPGKEMLLILAGITLIIAGAQLRGNLTQGIMALPITIAGIAFKISFIVVAVRKVRAARVKLNDTGQ